MERNGGNVKSEISHQTVALCAQTRCCCRNVSSSSSSGAPVYLPGPSTRPARAHHFKLPCEPPAPDSTLSPSSVNGCGRRLHGGRLPPPARLCGCLQMESYEEFCERSWARLQESGESTKTREPRRLPKPHSLIRFHRRAVLSPLVRKSAVKLGQNI